MNCVDFIAFTNLIVLSLTLIVLIFYTRDTHRIANQTQEANLRPVILRCGYIPSWDSLRPHRENQTVAETVIQFVILKNIATDISGYIILNNSKYQLCFGNTISSVGNNAIILNENPSPNKTLFQSNWGWMQPNEVIYAVIYNQNPEPSDEHNQIYVSYKDIEGNEFYTAEDSNFNQKSFRKKHFN